MGELELFLVADGHGGAEAAQAVSQSLLAEVVKGCGPVPDPADLTSAVTTAFVAAHAKVRAPRAHTL